MMQEVFRSGDSLVVSLPAAWLHALGLQEGSEVSVRLDLEKREMIISLTETPLAEINERFAEQLANFIEAYRPALEALAR